MLSLILIQATFLLAEGHFGSIVQVTSFLMYAGFVLSTVGLILGGEIKQIFKYILLRQSSLPQGRSLVAISVLEKASFTAGILAGLMGLVYVMRINQPNLSGAGVAVSITGMIYSIFFNTVFLIPAKFALLSGPEKTESTRKFVDHIPRALIGVAGVLTVGLGVFLEGDDIAWYLSIPGFLMAFLLPLLLVAVYEPPRGQGQVYAWISDLCLSGSLLASLFLLIDWLENLDKPELLIPSAAMSCAIPCLYGLVTGVYFNLKADYCEKFGTPKNLTYPLFTLSIIALLTLIIAFLFLALLTS